MLRKTLWILAATSSLASFGACKWTEFDDLADTTWVHSQGKPDVNSTDYALSLLQVQHNGDGGTIAVIGANEPTFSTLIYDTKGNTKLGSAAVDLNKEYTINSIPDAPALVSDPETDNVALVIPSTEGRTVVLDGPADALVELTLDDPKPNTATFVSSGVAGTPSALLVTGTGTFHGIDTTNKASTCKVTLADTTTPLQALALAISGTSVLAWTDKGLLVTYDLATVQGTCDGTTVLAAVPTGTAVDTGFLPGPRSKLIPVGDHYVLLAGIAPMDTGAGMVGVLDLSTGLMTNTPAMFPGLRSFALGSIEASTYAVLGFPARAVQSVPAGQVEVHELDLTAASGPVLKDEVKLSLSDAQPQTNQSFGRAVEIMHFNDDAIIVVAGDNEIFSYYRPAMAFTDTRK